MYNKKPGFTIAETLVCLGVISIILIYSLTTMKPNQKAMKYLYRNAYSALNNAYYNGVMLGHEPFKDDLAHTENNDQGTEQLCRALSSFINSTDTTMQDGKDYSASCSPTKITSQLGNEFKDENVQFIAAGSGMRFFISNLLNTGNGEIPFYLVFVDINGREKGPNRMTFDEKKDILPDIYAFAATQDALMVPLGIPEYDTRILSSRIAYISDEGDEMYSRISKPYYQSKGEAWGFYSSTSDNLKDPVKAKLPEEAHTMNDYIRSKIDPNSNIVKDFPDLTQLPYQPLPLASEKYGCVELDLEACYLIMDEYRY